MVTADRNGFATANLSAIGHGGEDHNSFSAAAARNPKSFFERPDFLPGFDLHSIKERRKGGLQLERRKNRGISIQYGLLAHPLQNMNMKALLLSLSFLLVASLASAAELVVVVRHAEKIDNSEDAKLSAEGHARAERLAGILRDAHITAIFASERKRTQETAAPLAKLIGVSPTIGPAKDYASLLSKIREVHGTALVVGHGNTIAEIIKGLGVEAQVEIADNDYTDLFVIVLEAHPQLLRLHY